MSSSSQLHLTSPVAIHTLSQGLAGRRLVHVSAEGVVVVFCDGIVTQLGLRVGGRLYLSPLLQLSSFVNFAVLQGE